MNDSVQKFLKLVDGACTRCDMYVAGGSFLEVCALLDGYLMADREASEFFRNNRAFSRFVCAKIGFPDKYGHAFSIKAVSESDDHALELFRQFTNEYVRIAQGEDIEKVIETLWRDRSPEGEPERIWREFYSALLRGDHAKIESMSAPNPELSLLSESGYPIEVAEKLDEISRSNPIAVISQSESDQRARIFTADIGPIDLLKRDDQWLVDVSPILEFRKKTSKT